MRNTKGNKTNTVLVVVRERKKEKERENVRKDCEEGV